MLRAPAADAKLDVGVNLDGDGRMYVRMITDTKFEVYKDKAGEFRFRLKARNGEIIAVGEGYKAKPACLNGIESIRKNAPEAPVVVEE